MAKESANLGIFFRFDVGIVLHICVEFPIILVFDFIQDLQITYITVGSNLSGVHFVLHVAIRLVSMQTVAVLAVGGGYKYLPKIMGYIL